MFGFEHFHLSKIVARAHINNERSRKVLEKSGMSYCGMIDFKNDKVPYYEIHNNKIELESIKLIPAVANICFDQFSGQWEVMVMPENEGAYRFWRSVISHRTLNNFSEATREVPHFKNIKNIFYFDTNNKNKRN